MKFFGSMAGIVVSCMLAACAPAGMRMVDAVDSDGFSSMSRAMHREMFRRNLVDSYGSWYSPLFSVGPFRAGEQLAVHLSPKFRFPHAGVAVPATFKDLMGEDAKFTFNGPQALIEQGLSRVELKLLAVADWNGDGKNDWLARCRVWAADDVKKFRDYFVAVENTKNPVWDARLLMILDHVYGRVIAVGDPSGGVLAESLAVDYRQGQATILEEPGRKDASIAQERVRQSRLRN